MRVTHWDLLVILQFLVQDITCTLKYVGTVEIFVGTSYLGPQSVLAEGNINGRDMVEYPDSIIGRLWSEFDVGVLWPLVGIMKQACSSQL
jgi:hypothetical protein